MPGYFDEARRTARVFAFLFPPKQLNRRDVDNDDPSGDSTDLRQDFDETSMLSHDQTETISNRRHRDELSSTAQPFWEHVQREERTRQEHHRERNQVG